MYTRRTYLALAALLLCVSVSSGSHGNSSVSFAVCPCVDYYAGIPGDCPSTEPLAMSLYQTGPSIVYNTNRSMGLFIRDGNAYLQYIPQSGTGATSWSSGWQYLYGSLNGDPVAISRKGGSLEVFYIGLNEAVWHIRQSSPGSTQWGKHTAIGGAAGGQVTVAYDAAADKAQLFYKGDNQSLMTITENGGAWGKPAAILPPGSVTSNIAYIDLSGVRYLFFRGADGSLKSVTLWPGSVAASAPATLTRPWTVTSNIAPAIDVNGAIIAFYRGPDYALWDVPSGSGGWGHPVSLGGRANSDLYTTTLPGKQIRVYYRAADGGVYYVQQDQNAAAGWSRHKHLLGLSTSAKNTSGATLLSQTLFSNPVVGVNQDQRQEVFFVGNEGGLWHMWETAASSPQQPYPAWSPQAAMGGTGLAPRGNSIIAAAAVGAQPIASYTALDAATVSDIMGIVPFFTICSLTPNSVIGYNHALPSCNSVPMISRAMGIALLIDDIQTVIHAVKVSTTGSVTQAQFDALVKAQLKKMGIL